MIVREYHGSDSNLLITARAHSASYLEDEALFVGFNSVTFIPVYRTNFDAAIVLASAAANDEYVVDLLVAKTNEVNIALDDCKDAYPELLFAVRKAYPKKPSMWIRFGSDDYGKIGRSHSKMIEFYEVIHKAADEDKTNLIEKGGYTQEKIDNLKTLREKLKAKKTEQKNAMNKRPATTDERITLHNNVFHFMKQLNEAAQIIFRDTPAKLKQYELPSSTSSGTEETPTPEPNPVPTPAP